MFRYDYLAGRFYLNFKHTCEIIDAYEVRTCMSVMG